MDRNHHYPFHFQPERDEEQQRHATNRNQFHPGVHSSHHSQARFADPYHRPLNNLDYRDPIRHQDQYQYSHTYQNAPQMQQRVAMQPRQDFPFQNEERSSRMMDDLDNMNMQPRHVHDFAQNNTGRIREEPVFSFHRRGFAQDRYQNKQQQRLFEQQNIQYRPQEDMRRQEQQIFQEDQEQQLLAREQQMRLRRQEQMEFRLGDIDFQGSNPNSPSRLQLQQQSVQNDGQYRLQPHHDVSLTRQPPEKLVNEQIGVQQRDNTFFNDGLGRQFQQRREEEFNDAFQNAENGERNQRLANEVENRMRMQPNVFAQHRQYEQERLQKPFYRREGYRENHFPYHEDNHMNAMNRQALEQHQHRPQQHNPWNQMIPRNEFRFNDANRNDQHVQDRQLQPQPHAHVQGIQNAMHVDENYRQRVNHQHPYANVFTHDIPYKLNSEGQNSNPEKVKVKQNDNIVNDRHTLKVGTKKRKSLKNHHSSYKSNAYPSGFSPKETPKLPSVEEIVSQFPNNASSIMFILDRRINMKKVSGYEIPNEENENELTVYELLRAWVRDDPYRERAKKNRGILDHIDLPYEKHMNDSDEKNKEKVERILTEGETLGKSDVKKEELKVCDLFASDEKDSKINSSDMDAVGKAFQESILKGKTKRRKRSKLLKKRDEVCLASLKRKHGIVIKS